MQWASRVDKKAALRFIKSGTLFRNAADAATMQKLERIFRCRACRLVFAGASDESGERAISTLNKPEENTDWAFAKTL